jgi:hypothetical protein
MKDKYDAMSCDPEFESIESELLINLIAFVKFQQLNIELLWKELAAGKPPAPAIAQMRETASAFLSRSSRPTE